MHREESNFTIHVNIEGLENIGRRLFTSLDTIDAITQNLMDAGRIAQRRAVANVSGVVRSFEGKTFVVNRRSGNLAREIQVTMPNPLAVTIEASADYASDIELGTRGPTDLKKTTLAGKIVPLPLTQAQGKAIQSAKGNLKSILVGRFNQKSGPMNLTKTTGFKANSIYATTGKFMGTSFILFRRVPSRGGVGWIIPQQPAKPFMREAGTYAAPFLAEMVESTYADFLETGMSGDA